MAKYVNTVPACRSLRPTCTGPMLGYNPTVDDEVVADVPADMEDGEAADMDHEG